MTTGSETMRATCLRAPGSLQLADFPVPAPRSGEVLVRMEHASICGSDLHIVFDELHNPDALGAPGYPGHEGVGTVVESRSSDPGLAVGTPVLTVPSGRAGGCFAEFQVVGEQFLVPLPEAGDRRRLLMAQQLGTTVYALKKFVVHTAGDAGVAVVIGAGSAGLFFVQLLRARGHEVVVSDRDPGRLEVARRLGAQPVRVPDESLADVVTEATDGVGADLVIEAAGYDDCRAEAVVLVRAHGTVGCFGYPERAGLAPFPVLAAFRKSATVSWISGTQLEPGLRSFREAVELIERGEVDVDFCLEHSLPLEQTLEGMEIARTQGAVVKVTIDLLPA